MLDDRFNPVHLLLLVAVVPSIFAVLIIPYWLIFKKAGFTPLLGLLMVVPAVNLIVLYVVAFSQWRVAPLPPGYPTYPPMPPAGYDGQNYPPQQPPYVPPPTSTNTNI